MRSSLGTAHCTSTGPRTPTNWNCSREMWSMCWRSATTDGSWAPRRGPAASAHSPATTWNGPRGDRSNDPAPGAAIVPNLNEFVV